MKPDAYTFIKRNESQFWCGQVPDDELKPNTRRSKWRFYEDCECALVNLVESAIKNHPLRETIDIYKKPSPELIKFWNEEHGKSSWAELPWAVREHFKQTVVLKTKQVKWTQKQLEAEHARRIKALEEKEKAAAAAKNEAEKKLADQDMQRMAFEAKRQRKQQQERERRASRIDFIDKKKTMPKPVAPGSGDVIFYNNLKREFAERHDNLGRYNLFIELYKQLQRQCNDGVIGIKQFNRELDILRLAYKKSI